MANPPPPDAPVEKKRGMGCWGCGCLILALVAVLFLGLVAGGAYLLYSEAVSLTSTTPATVPSFTGTDDVYQTAREKLSGFDHDLKNHQAATIQLSADEINALISRDPDFIENKIHLYVTLSNDQARAQISLPVSFFQLGILRDRYLNADTSFGLNFDPSAKTLNLDLRSAQVGDRDIPADYLPMTQNEINQVFNQMMQKDPNFEDFLQQAKSIRIKDGELVIETQ